jgi:hypothetical protein
MIQLAVSIVGSFSAIYRADLKDISERNTRLFGHIANGRCMNGRIMNENQTIGGVIVVKSLGLPMENQVLRLIIISTVKKRKLYFTAPAID